MPTMALCQSIRSFDKVLEESQLTGELRLGGRGLRELPTVAGRYTLTDILVADISKNRLLEIPGELIENGSSLEELDLYHNSVRSIPDSICKLRSLTYLNLSRNQLTYLPPALCLVPLEVLIVSYNKLVSLPEEVGQLSRLKELDARCNEISQVPVTLRHLETLVSLNLRRNSLQQLPEDAHCLMALRFLDVAENQIQCLPLQMRLMTSLEQLDVTCNPLVFPPAHVCARGRQHIYKYLEIKALRGEQEERVRRGATDELEVRSLRTGPYSQPSAGYQRDSSPPPAPCRQQQLYHHQDASPAASSRTSLVSQADSTGRQHPGYDAAGSGVQLRRFEPARSASGLVHTGPPRSAFLHHATPASVTAPDSYSSTGHHQPAPPAATSGGYSSTGHHQPAPPAATSGGYSSTGHHQPALTAAEVERVRRERECIERLRQNIETRLRVTLPDDLRSALRDGVVLCHLANHVRPRAVSSIHVPSPAVPKLNEAKCRRNLQNFLDACRRIGVEEEPICSGYQFAIHHLLLASPDQARPNTPPPYPPGSPSCQPLSSDPPWLTPALLATLALSWLVLYLLPEPQ